MHEYTATIHWARQGEAFTDNRYSRRHSIAFDGGHTMPGSSSPHTVREPMSDASGVDPEEAFVASLSSCHMLWFLDIACKAGFVVDAYRDDASGVMGRNAQGQIAMTHVTLHPAVTFGGDRRPDVTELNNLHHRAHRECFIANSVKTEVRCEPVLTD